MDYLESAEQAESSLHFQTDIRIAWSTVRLAALGHCDPFRFAVLQALHCQPEQVWERTVAQRKRQAGSLYASLYDENGNFRSDLPEEFFASLPPRKPVQSERDPRWSKGAA